MKKVKKRLAWLVAVCMSITTFPVTSLGMPGIVQASEGILAHFTFDDDTDGFTGGGAVAAKNGAGISLETDAVSGQSVRLTGTGSWLNVKAEDGTSLLTGKNDITISYYSKSEKSGANWSIFAAPNTNAQTYKSEHYLGILDNASAVQVERYNNSGSRPSVITQSTLSGSWKYVTVVVEESSTTLYINGVLQETLGSSYKLSDILGSSSVLQIGKGNWGSGEYYNGYIDELTIYDHALTGEEVAEAFDTTGEVCKQETLETASSQLISAMGALGDNHALTVSGDMTLLAATSNGTSVSWASSDESLITTDGKVTRPSGDENGTVTLTATLRVGSSTKEIMFEVTVLRQETDGAAVEWVKEALSLTQTENIKGNITLPTENDYGAVITWGSSDPNVISDEEAANENYDPMPAGVVTRGDTVQEVTLTATIQKGETVAKKEFHVTVAAKAEEKDLENYLFAYFPSNTEEQIYFAAGTDELHFTDLNEGSPVLTSNIGDQGVRDPYIFRSAQGDHFYMLATDLKVETTGWTKAQYGGSLNLVIWESDDLVNWSSPRLVDVGISGYENIGCVWAPEAIYDEKTGEYVVFWASMTGAQGASGTHQIVYYSKTRDFVNFTKAEKYIDRGGSQHCIDTSMVKVNDKYYRVSADGEITIETSDSVLGNWTKISTLKSLSAGMEGYSAFFAEKGITLTGGVVEGPELFKFNNEDRWGLFVDNYGGVGYIPISTTDISDTTGSTWKIYDSDDYNFGTLKKRHGSIVGITTKEYQAIMAKWGNTAEENTEQEQEDPVLLYDFNETVSNSTIQDQSGNHYNGTLYGSAAYTTDSEKGNVLYLDGTSGTYAGFPTGFFDGRNKFTVSFDMKAVTVSGNFFNFAIGKNSTKYLFLRLRDTAARLAITTASYGEEEAATATTASIADKWVHYTVVVNEDTMSLYQDGIQIGTVSDMKNSIIDLGSNLLAYLGKSFYSSDAYFKGYYDNVAVYNRVLSELEIAEKQGITLDALKGVTSDEATIITEKLDTANHTDTIYVSKNNTGGDLTDISLDFNLVEGAKITEGLKDTYDLTKDIKIQTTLGESVKTWTIKTVVCNNPVLGGEYADPDIDVFNGKYYIYPTTDGYSGWSGTKFHVFSSDDLVNWEDEGVILDLAANTDEEAGINSKGVQIASVPWSNGSAWAPSIEEKNGKYYFYFCGNDTSTNKKAIGVAVADCPTGPFTVASKPLITMENCTTEGITMGQAIDPSAFTDDNGTSYLLFGNGSAAIVQLGDDMMSYVSGTMKNITGATSFRESIIVTKRNGLYHFTWSCDDTGSENYKVNYGTSASLYGPITYRYTLLAKDTSKDILGTGHHSIVKVPGKEEYYIAYHRFLTPLGQITSGFGYHRETCIDQLTFDEATGLMNVVTPTLEGITTPVKLTVTLNYQAGTGGRISGTAIQEVTIGGNSSAVTAVPDAGYRFTKWSDGVTTATRKDTNVTAEKTLTALFEKLTYTLTYQAGSGGKITGTALQTVKYGGSAAAVTAVPDAGYKFIKWSDGVTTASRTDTNVTAGKTVTALFEPLAAKVTLNTKKITLGVKETYSLTAEVTPSNASAETKKVTWKTSNSKIATVSANGKITAKKTGKVKITATTGNGKTATCTVTVKTAPSKISLNATNKTLKKGKTFQIKVTLSKNSASNKITYTSSNKKVATVSASGKIKAIKKGTTTITVKAFNGKSQKIKITVK
ncbi:family 43 glycosylhydrolase [Konateibacter massiliensis]|uniref:family 43 glycosylhydrolase n=1 Tax=Konateibacter massiliensis TaxID=2002841 RepID=UPI0015D47468|nr:family 43 glycosylhydrolase [Konateibacter massiliensis]